MIRPVWFIAPAMVCAASLLGIYHAAQEVESSTYVSIIEAWPRLPAPLRAELRSAMGDEQLSTWEWRGLHGEIMDAAGYLTWHLAAATPDNLEEARRQFNALIQAENQ